MKHLGFGNRAQAIAFAPAMLEVIEAGQSRTYTVPPGRRLVVGRDQAANIVLADQQASPSHATIERLGPGWLVDSLDAANPAWILDHTGRAQPIEAELGLRSGQLVIGGSQVLLYPPPATTAPPASTPSPEPPTPSERPPELPQPPEAPDRQRPLDSDPRPEMGIRA